MKKNMPFLTVRNCTLLAGLLLLVNTSTAIGQSAEKVHQKAIVVDTHNDILMKVTDNGMVFDQNLTGKTHTDLARWKKGGLDVQIFSVYCDGALKNPFAYAKRQMDSLDAVIARNPSKIGMAANYAALKKMVKQHKIAAMIGVEGGHMIEGDLNNLDYLYQRGARYLTLTHNASPAWVSSAYDEKFTPSLPHKGLAEFGVQVVKRMNQLGMMVDVSHLGETSFWEMMKITTSPVIASHSSVYNLCAHQRNLKDDQIRAIASNGGVIQINFYSGFLDSNYDARMQAFMKKYAAEVNELKGQGIEEFDINARIFAQHKAESDGLRAPFDLVIQHIEYIINLVGEDYVGLGSDFDGIEAPPLLLDDVTTYPLITKALLDKGYSKKTVTKILGGNFLRVLKTNEKNSTITL